MKLPSVPGPSDLIAAVEGLREGISDALALVPRLGTVVGRVERLLDRVDAVVDRADELIDGVDAIRTRADEAIGAVAETRRKADDALTAMADTQRKADAAITAVGDTQRKADDAITAVRETTTSAAGTLTTADELVGRLSPLMADYEGPLRQMAPSVQRLAETLDPHEIEALIVLIDRLPVLVTHLDEDILPVLRSLGGVGTDVHDLLDTVQDLRQVVKGFPGSKLFRRRGAEEIAQEEAEEAPGG